MTSKLRVWALSILCAAVVGGCEEKKDEAKKDEGAKTTASATATSGATATPTAGGATTGGSVTTPAAVGGASAAAGDLFKYMPADCPMGRIYVNQAALFTPELTATFQQLQEKMLAAGTRTIRRLRPRSRCSRTAASIRPRSARPPCASTRTIRRW